MVDLLINMKMAEFLQFIPLLQFANIDMVDSIRLKKYLRVTAYKQHG